MYSIIFFFSSRRRHTRCALVTGVQTCALPILAFNRRHRPNRFVGQLEPSKRSNPAGDVVWLGRRRVEAIAAAPLSPDGQVRSERAACIMRPAPDGSRHKFRIDRSEEHTSELQSLMRISYAVLCLKTKRKH